MGVVCLFVAHTCGSCVRYLEPWSVAGAKSRLAVQFGYLCVRHRHSTRNSPMADVQFCIDAFVDASFGRKSVTGTLISIKHCVVPDVQVCAPALGVRVDC